MYLATASTTGSDNAVSIVLFIALSVVGFIAYWVPTAVALIRHHRSPGPIVIINLFLGWTIIGWIVALAMAVSAQPASQQEPGPPWPPAHPPARPEWTAEPPATRLTDRGPE
jgi:hypothetical protein